MITELASLWPELKIVHGKPRHSQSQGSVERANQDIENMLAVWMKDNKTTQWAQGLKFIQFMKNRSLHSGIKQAPYKAMFGFIPRIGLSSSKLPSEIIKNIQTEDDLHDVLGENQNTGERIRGADKEQVIHQDKDLQEKDDEMGVTEGTIQISNSSAEDSNLENIVLARKRAAEGLKKQAKKMKSTSDKNHPEVGIEDNVTIPIPDVDKAKSDLRNVIGLVLEKKMTCIKSVPDMV